tara:strand:- start:319 stop:651 length:333 start_codon:yes stop_codon:yes gene_type:complete
MKSKTIKREITTLEAIQEGLDKANHISAIGLPRHLISEMIKEKKKTSDEIDIMSNITLNKIKEGLENEVWYQELRLNAKVPILKETKDIEIAINRKELAESILNLIKKGK